MSRSRSRLGLAFAALLASTLAPAAADTAFLTPDFVMGYGDDAEVSDYRPAINPDATRVVFERSFYDPAKTSYSRDLDLYVVDLATPRPPFATAKKLVPQVPGAARPDYCPRYVPSVDPPLAFSAEAGVYLYLPPLRRTILLPKTAGYFYPTFFPGCESLAVDDGLGLASPRPPHHLGPTTKKIGALTGAYQGSLTGASIWAGFPSVNPVNPNLIAFAGQRFPISLKYEQNQNYVYIADTSKSLPAIITLAPAAPQNEFNHRFEGRAPTWSPDGRWIAFESDRFCNWEAENPNFALFLQDSQGLAPARQLTDCRYDGQHPKWVRKQADGTQLLIATLRIYPFALDIDKNAPPQHVYARGIATVDVTALVK